MELTEYIASLLKQHNCVIVPHFGGFIANYKSAVIDHTLHRIIPPSKSILFNPKLVTNDGLLGHTIADSRSISYTDSLAYVQTEVNQWEQKLNAGQRVELGEIGFLFRQNNQVIFEQHREAGILLQAYGLSSISFVDFTKSNVAEVDVVAEKTTQRETVVIELNTAKQIEKTTAQTENVVPLVGEKKRSNGFKYLAVAAAIPLLFYSYWIPMETDFLDTGKIQMADFNPIKNSPKQAYQTRLSDFVQLPAVEVKTWDDLTQDLSDNVSVYNYQMDDDLYIPVRLDKTATNLPPVEDSNVEMNGAESALVYHLIAGCFSMKENADNFVAELQSKGHREANVFDYSGGLYRVSAADFTQINAANEKLAIFKANGFSGWILKK